MGGQTWPGPQKPIDNPLLYPREALSVQKPCLPWPGHGNNAHDLAVQHFAPGFALAQAPPIPATVFSIVDIAEWKTLCVRGDPCLPPAESAHYLVNLLSICAGLLGVIALLLLWRLRGLYAQMQNDQLSLQQAEHALLLTRRQIEQMRADRQHIEDQERRRLGRDLHDDLGQYLLTLKMDVANLQANTGDGTPAWSRPCSSWPAISTRASRPCAA